MKGIKITLSPKEAVELLKAINFAKVHFNVYDDICKEMQAKIVSYLIKHDSLNDEFSEEVENLIKTNNI